MLVGAATVKDSLAHVRRFVTGNLAGGLDHLVVFLDAPGADGQPEVRRHLESEPHVTCVRAGREWWGERRPAELNERQCTNAGAVRLALGETGGDHWVFHVDGDEVVRVARDVLAAQPPAARAAQLAVREAVSRFSWPGEPTLFKWPLADADLARLHDRGLIEQPSNRAWFHGHLQGKPGVRATAPLWLGLHRVLDADGRAVEAVRDDRLEVFHYESYSGEDFVRKWTAMVASGPPASYRPGRAALARRIHALVGSGLPDDELRARLVEVYRTTTEDDVDALRPLGVLHEVDPLAGGHRPAPDPAAVAALRAGLERLRGAPKAGLYRGASARRG